MTLYEILPSLRCADTPNRPGDMAADPHVDSMASTVNVVGRPPMVAVKDGRTRELVRRETIGDLLSRDRVYKEPPPMRRARVESGGDALLHGE